ncbi:YitT family protein, partial [Bacillus pumilus]|uniref:YitT family protein n=1 Tax=Bacillus pumilus TaxID=1408 RepID=UPI0037047693
MNKYTPLTLPTSLPIIHPLILLPAITLFPIQHPLYPLIPLFISTKTIHLLQPPFTHSKIPIIITRHHHQLTHALFHQIHRPLTKISPIRPYTHHHRPILMC